MKRALIVLSLALVACGESLPPDQGCALLKKDLEIAQKDDAAAERKASSWSSSNSDAWKDVTCLDEALISDASWLATQKQPLTLKSLQDVITKQRKDCSGSTSSSSSTASSSASS